jgi:hypothetical protein
LVVAFRLDVGVDGGASDGRVILEKGVKIGGRREKNRMYHRASFLLDAFL